MNKKIAGYHQFHVVQAAVESVVRATEGGGNPPPKRAVSFGIRKGQRNLWKWYFLRAA